MTDIKQLLPTTIYQAATDPLSLRGAATAGNPFSTISDILIKTLTGYVSGPGVISSSDTILQAIQKLNGNIAASVTGVSSVFGRSGAVVAQSGDYTTTLVPEGTNLYFTNSRVNTQVATYAGDVTLTGSVFTIGALKVLDSMINTVSWSKITGTPTTLSGYGIILTNLNVTSALGFTPYNATNPAGYISGITSGDVITALGFTPFGGTNPLPVVNGGTGFSSYLVGDILYADTTTTFAKIPFGTAGQVLKIIGGIPQWSTDIVGTGTVTSVSVVSANGFAGIVTNPTTTPAITISTTVTGLLKGNGISISAAVAGTDYQLPISLTTTGSSGASTFIANVLNIPNYTLSGLGGVSSTRLLTINGLAQDLSADRTWTITTTGTANRVTVIGGAGLTPTIDIALTYVGQTSITTLGTITTGVWQGTPITNVFLANSSITINTGTGLSGGGVVALGGTLTLINTKYLTTLGLSAGVLTATLADATTVTTLISTTNITEGTNLYYTDARARNAISLTTTGSSGASTYSSLTGVLNVPNYTLAGLGGQPLSTNLTSLSGLTFVSTSFVKMTAAGTFALDTNTYLTGNQNITLTGDVTGSGTTVIATTAAPTIVKTVILNTPNIIFSTPITFVTAANTATGTLVLNTQAANTVFAGPSTGANATPTFRVLVTADMPATVALLASPTFTGIPAAPTAAPGTNTTQLATTAFVTAGIAAIPISTTAGNTLGTCITTLFVSTINSCSPLNINPTNGQNIIALATPGTAQFLIGTSTVNPTLLGILRIGQGTSTIDVGESTAGFGTVWLSQVTPSTSNYALKTSSVTGNTTLNAKTGGVITLNIADTLKWTANTANRFTSADGKIVLDPVNASVKINGATDNDQISGYSNASATVNWLRFKADNRDAFKDALLFTSVESGTSGSSTLTINSRTAVSRLNVYSDGGGVFLATNITGGGIPEIGTTGSDLIFSPSTNVIRFDTTTGQIGTSTRGIGSLYVGGSFGLIQQPSGSAAFAITTGLTRDNVVGSALNITGSATFLNLGRYFSIADSTNTTLFSVGKLGNTAIGTSLTANSTLHIGGSVSFPYRLVTAATSFTATDYTIDSTTASFTVTLPTAIGIQGRVYVLKNTSGGIKTLAANGVETIDGVATKLVTNGNFIRVQSTGANWIIIG